MDRLSVTSLEADAQNLWQEAGSLHCPTGKLSPELLKAEGRVRIIQRVVSDLQQPVVSKIYRVPLHIAWRNLFLPSRARREYHRLRYAHQRGLPVVEPLAWAETRIWGCPVYGKLTMATVDGEPLPQAMNDPRMTSSAQREVATALGSMLARMHVAGMVWLTAYARNVMVSFSHEADCRPLLVAIDFPYVWCTGRNRVGGGYALTDLWWMRKTCIKKCNFNDNLIQHMVNAYAREAGIDPVTLAEQVRKYSMRASTWRRICARSLQALSI